MAHIHEKIDFTASVFIVRDGKVLLHWHKKLNKWLQPGGHIELDEDPNQAALREAKEETGYDIELVGGAQAEMLQDGTDLIPPRFVNRHYFDATKTHEHIDLTYFGRIIGGEETPEEGSEIRWFSREEIENGAVELYPATRAYALAALDELGA
jgi:8-oxo-dGTP pyrophosphatase MutT (NUDIX family)